MGSDAASGRPPGLALLGLVLLGVLLTVTAVPGAFSIDESNYVVTVLGLREGRLSVPGTAGLPPSRELAYFDPLVRYRGAGRTPVPTTAPPLYAPIALPFAYLGWRGLVLLNTLAFLVTGVLVFRYAREHATSPPAGWLALGAFALGGYALEYAQAVWPHMLSAALTTGAAYALSRLRRGGSAWLALGAGLLGGVAAGVRYQNIVVVAALGLGLVIWSWQRWRTIAGFALGAAMPLAAAAAMNQLRLGALNPVSKGPGYIPRLVPTRAAGRLVADTARMFWARVVDYTIAPHTANMQPEPVTGVFVLFDTVKKAWLQSAPWLALGLALLALAWPTAAGLAPAARREARALSLVVFAVLLALSAAGLNRTDGFGFNQRYFIELVPLAAVAFAWALDGTRLAPAALLAGALAGGALAGASRLAVSLFVRLEAQRFLPLALAALLLMAWALARGRPGAPALGILAGATLGWALGIHAVDDLPGSRGVRAINASVVRALAPVLGDRSSLFAGEWLKDAGGPLQLERDVVVVDASADDGRDARMLAAALLAQGRRVFVLANELPGPVLGDLARAGRVRRVAVPPPLELLEVEGTPAGATP